MMLKERPNGHKLAGDWGFPPPAVFETAPGDQRPTAMPLPRRSIPSFTSLIAFEATASHLSFSQAAKELALSQGAISKHVRQLEDLLGVVLFERTRRHVVLTEEGRAYLKEVRDLISRLEHSTHSMLASGGSFATLNLAVLPSFAVKWLIPRLPRFAAGERKITVNLATRAAPFAFDYERFDAAIHYGSPHWPGAVSMHLFDEAIIAVASPLYCCEASLKEPRDLEHAVLVQQAMRPSLWMDWFETLGLSPRQPFSGPMVDQFTLALEMAAAGLGVALVPEFLVTEDLAAGRLVMLFGHRHKTPYGYHLVTPAGKINNPTVRCFADWLKSEVAVLY